MNKKIQHSIELIKKAETLALSYSDEGFHLAFSGGKDSQVIYELAKMAEVKFKAYFYKTSVDPRALLSFRHLLCNGLQVFDSPLFPYIYK